MPVRRRLAALAAAALLAAPAPAFAQSAGDDQYEDPFGGEQQEQTQQPESTPAPAATPAPTAAPAPATATPAPAPSSTEAAPPAAAAPAAAPGEELPRTGFDAALMIAAGAVLLGGGLVLRIRLRERG
jgi:LPXTG-motif cell wall-anchored protein